MREFKLAKNRQKVLVNTRKIVCVMESADKEKPVTTLVMQAPERDAGVLVIDVEGTYKKTRRRIRWGL